MDKLYKKEFERTVILMFELIITIIGYCIVIVFIYNILISIFSLKIKGTKLKEAEDSVSFSVLIPSHNEEEVLWGTLDSINKSNYKKDLIKVYVIADNCTDNTVNLVDTYCKANSEFNCSVLEVSGGSKPKAINKAVYRLKNENLWNSDSIVILDADNRVSKTIFKNFNIEHLAGFGIVQCAIHSLNDSSFVARGFTSAFNNMNRGFQYARNKIGLSGSLNGTGFSVSREVWESVDFNNCDTLTEDLEFSILSILKGIRVKFIFNDYVLNQHLDEFAPSFVQRVRWSRGHTQVFMKLSFTVIKELFKKPSLQLFDSLLFMANPFRNLLYIVILILELIFNRFASVSIYLMILPIIYYVAFFMICDNWKIKYFFPHIFYSITMFFATAYGALTYKNTVWVKTAHKRVD